MTHRGPLVVVLGATACGKSRLAIELAQRFKGEIISADSMQVYKGLDIVTNKVTEEEQQRAKHHMINFLDPMMRYSVVDFRDKSLNIISNLHKIDKLPIVVGGTNYYIESLLWKEFLLGRKNEVIDEQEGQDNEDKTLIDSEAKVLSGKTKEVLHTDDDYENPEKFFSKPIYNDAFKQVESEKLWNILEKVDPKAAHSYHPHDKRRIIRSLQIIQRSQKNYSQILEDINKSAKKGKVSLGGPLRFSRICVIWLHCDNEILDKVMDERVDQMLNRGLLAELERFHEDYNKERIADGMRPEYDKGIFQTIGFKEFHDYLMLGNEDRHTEKGNALLKKSIEDMKLSTRRYARRQLKWIRRRFLQLGTRDLPSLFKIPTTFQEDEWLRLVQQPAFEIVESFIKERELNPKLAEFKIEPVKQEAINNPGKLYCDVCDKLFIGTNQINIHLSSRMHQKKVRHSDKQVKKQKVSYEESARGESTDVEYSE